MFPARPVARAGTDSSAERYPHIERHVSVQASATNEEAIRFYHRNFDVHRVVLPRVLS
ncbi:U32 family peptidase, partial [Salmonella enterica subsp. enterica serovar Anatum]|nr:U32 family peptidase [Salmonella enterica subsp. enterica serovar Anatum]